MELHEYQPKALATAQPEAFSLDYLVPGIVGEVGELMGQQAKAHWHGWPEQQLQAELASEYGDICWMTAVLLHTQQLNVVVTPSFPNTNDGRRPEADLLKIANQLFQQYARGVTHLEWEAVQLWRSLARNCGQITGHTMHAVLSDNLDKLADRAERGVLRGSGDHR